MATANDIQVGGTHYGGGAYQHWDWVCEVRMHYLPACASKYVTRARNKNGVEDLKKAHHYIVKAAEMGVTGAYIPHRAKAFWRFVMANDVSMPEAEACWYIMEGDWASASSAVVALLEQAA